MTQERRLRHIGIVVENLDDMVKFYQETFDMCPFVVEEESGEYIDTVIGQDGIKLKLVKLKFDEGSVIELLKYHYPIHLNESKKEVWHRGVSHIALTVNNIDEIHRSLKETGIEFISAPTLSSNGYAKVCFCRDPEGNFLELVEVQGGKSGG